MLGSTALESDTLKKLTKKTYRANTVHLINLVNINYRTFIIAKINNIIKIIKFPFNIC